MTARTAQPGRLAASPVVARAWRRARRLTGSAAWPVRSSRTVHGWAIACAGLSPVLLIVGWLAAGVVQPASYSPVRQTISVLSGQAGTDRWIMTGALLLVGVCDLLAAAGLGGIRASARILLAVAGLAGIGIAASPEPAGGSTVRHLAWTAMGAVTITIWPAFTARRGASRPLILSVRGAAVVTAVFAALLGWLVIETQGGSLLGLAERLTSGIQTCWPFIVALALQRAPAPDAQDAPDTPAGPLPAGHDQGRSGPAFETQPASGGPVGGGGHLLGRMHHLRIGGVDGGRAAGDGHEPDMHHRRRHPVP
jgi:hypothetical protein